MAVSSANRSGAAPARTAEEAETQLGDAVAVYLDDGPSGDAMPSSIVDLTGAVPRLLRAGAISEERLREVCGVLLSDDDDQGPEPAGTADESAGSAVTSAAKSAGDAPDKRSEAAKSSQDGRSPVTDAEKPTGADKDTPPTGR
jgi:L-threonylcarbamoyladenylate synthase